jgi:hypothetical protein
LAVCALCTLATLVTPAGRGFWTDIVGSMSLSRANQIMEWRPPSAPPDNLTFWFAAALLIVLPAFRHNRLKTAESRGQLAAALVSLGLAIRALRNISPFLMLAGPPLSVLLFRPVRASSGMEGRRGLLHMVALVAAVAAGLTVVVHTWRVRPDWHPISPAAASAVEHCRGPLYNRYVDGGALIFFAPRQKVLVDSRQDPYPAELVQAQFAVEETGHYEPLFERYGINCAALPPGSPTAAHLQQQHWITRFADDRWVVLERPTTGPPEP